MQIMAMMAIKTYTTGIPDTVTAELDIVLIVFITVEES
jgi:hypothetical protein